MTSINSYLTFQGNCRDAMTFYKNCLGGELVFQTIGESPLAEQMPKKFKHYVLNAALIHGQLVLAGSDMVPETGLIKGNAVSLMLNCSTADEAQTYYARLAADGHAVHPLERTTWGSLVGDLTDKFGNHWLLTYEKF